MHRRGIDTAVAQRIRAEQRRAAEARVTRLQEMRALERERATVAQSIVDVSADLTAAQRDLLVHQPSLQLEDIRRAAREEWAALKAQRQGPEPAPAARTNTAAQMPPAAPEARRSAEEERRQARERWLEGRRAGRWNSVPGSALDSQREREAKREAEKNKGIKRDRGRDDDYGL
jgi:hypothetical protein